MKRKIMGKHAIEEVLRTNPERLLRVYTQHTEGALHQSLKAAGVRVRVVPKKLLYSLVESDSHQGFIAEVRDKEVPTVKTFLSEQEGRQLVVMCDSITDPQNFGAILRACECFGVSGVVFSKNRNVGITPVVSKVSVGASELVTLLPVSNLVDTLKRFQDAGYYAVAAECQQGAQHLHRFSFPELSVLVIGAEGKGIQPLLSKSVDAHVKIPMHGHIDSLNVSQATATLLFHWSCV